MKRLLVLVMAILLVCGGVAFATTPGYRTSPGIGDKLGQGQFQSDPGKIFRMVRQMGLTPLTKDDIVIWDLTLDDGLTVGTTTTSADSAVAGILASACLQREAGIDSDEAATDDIGHRNWGWLQTYGLAQVDIAVAVGAGDAMGCSETAGEAQQFAITATGAAAGSQGNAGFFYDAGLADATDVECFIIRD